MIYFRHVYCLGAHFSKPNELEVKVGITKVG